MANTYTLQQCQPSDETYLLEWDEQDQIVAAVPNVNLTREELRELAEAIDNGDEIDEIDGVEFRENAAWARAQRWGYPLTAAYFADEGAAE